MFLTHFGTVWALLDVGFDPPNIQSVTTHRNNYSEVPLITNVLSFWNSCYNTFPATNCVRPKISLISGFNGFDTFSDGFGTISDRFRIVSVGRLAGRSPGRSAGRPGGARVVGGETAAPQLNPSRGGLGGEAPPTKIRGVWGAAPPSQIFFDFRKR